MPDVSDEIAPSSRGGWADRSSRGWLMFTGSDVLPFLQALVTNDVARLKSGEGATRRISHRRDAC